MSTTQPGDLDATSEIKILEFRMTTVESNMKDHEKRLRQMERLVWIAAGAASLASLIGSFLGKFLV